MKTYKPQLKKQFIRADKITYGFADTLYLDDKRHKRFEKQRATRGFDDTELWGLDISIAKFILPRLKAFRKSHHGHPGCLTAETWNEILDKMIVSFQMVLDDKSDWLKEDSEEFRVYDEGMKLFFEYYRGLWN